MVDVVSDRVVWSRNYFETFLPLREPMITDDVDEDPDRYGACVESHPDLARQRLQRGKKPYDSMSIDGWVYFWVDGKRFFGGGYYDPPFQTWAALLQAVADFVRYGDQVMSLAGHPVDFSLQQVKGTDLVRFSFAGKRATVPRGSFLADFADECERFLTFVESATGESFDREHAEIAVIRGGLAPPGPGPGPGESSAG